MEFKSPKINNFLKKTLRNGEAVLWKHENASGPMGHKLIVLYGFIFTLFWLGAVLQFSGNIQSISDITAAALQPPLPLFFAIGIIQLIVIVWLIFRINKFVYVVTDQRIILTNSASPMLTKFIDARGITSLGRTGSESKGNISLQEPAGMGFFSYSSIFTPIKIANIPEPKKVEALIYDRLIKPLKENSRK